MFRLLASRWFLVSVLLVGLVAPATSAWAHGGFSSGHGYYNGHGGYYSGHGNYRGHSYYSPYYYGHSYVPSWHSYGVPYGYGYSVPAFDGAPYPPTYSYPATSSDYARAPSGSGGGCR